MDGWYLCTVQHGRENPVLHGAFALGGRMRVSSKRQRKENARRSVNMAMQEYESMIAHRRQKYLRQLKAIYRKKEKAAPERQF